MLFMIYGIDGKHAAAGRATARAAHYAYLEEHQDIVVLGGATLADDDDARTGSVLIINVPNREAADKFAANEPLMMAGVFDSQVVTRMRRGQWNPAAAPKSAEGD